MIVRRLLQRSLNQTIKFSFSQDDDEKVTRGASKTNPDIVNQLKRRFTGQIKIEQRFHAKTSNLYDRYMQTRERPLICHDGLNLVYQFLIERPPIFAPFHPYHFSTERNRYHYSKKTGFYVPIPKELKIDDSENIFKDYDDNNQQNDISHQIVLSQTERINYRQNSRVWKWADPNVIDPHSIQAYGTHTVYLIVKQKGKWIFPSKLVTQRDTHKTIFEYMSLHLFQSTPFPVMHFPTRKPMGIRHSTREGLNNKARVLTFRGISAFGIPKFPTKRFQDFAWVPKPKLADYFQDNYFEQTIWAATHNFT